MKLLGKREDFKYIFSNHCTKLKPEETLIIILLVKKVSVVLFFTSMLVSDVEDSLCWWQVSNLVTVMLVTSLCWWLYDGDWFQMLVAESLCWRPFSSWSFLNVLNQSPTSWIGHQHLKLVTNTFGLQHPSPTSM